MPAIVEPQVAAKEAPLSLEQRISSITANNGPIGSDGELLNKPAVPGPKKASEAPKKDEAKVDEKPQSTETVKVDDKSKVESFADKMAKIKDGNLDESKKTESKPEEKPDLSKLTKEQKEAHTYKTLREKADKYEATQKELEELKGRLNGTDLDALKKELEDIKKVADERQNKLAAVDITQSDKYKREVFQPLGKIFKELQENSKEFGFSWKDFVDAVEKPTHLEREQALSAVILGAEKEVNPFTQLSILSGVNEYLQRQEFGELLIKNASAVQEAMKIEDAEKAEAGKKHSESEFNRVAGIVFDHVINPDLADDIPFLFTDRKDSDGNLIIDPAKSKQIRDSASYGESPAHIRALQSYSTELLPMVISDNKTLRKEKAELEERISQLSNAGPKIDGGAPVQETKDEGDKLTLEQRIAKIQRSQS